MNTNTVEIIAEQAAALTEDQRGPAIRELMESELFLVGGGGGDVVWSTPPVPLP